MLFMRQLGIICLTFLFGGFWGAKKCLAADNYNDSWFSRFHEPPMYKPTRYVEGTEMPPPSHTPDFRIEEDTWLAYSKPFFREENRPYRISPHFKQVFRWSKVYNKEVPKNLGCYCTTVYRRLTLLAGCAVITSRHILTTATSTELILERYKDHKHLTNILGAWYDHDGDTFNSSLYMTPARIHYHPDYFTHHDVNHTHPMPFTHDLAVWAATYKFLGTTISPRKAVICARGGPHWFQFLSSTPRHWEMAHIVGFQFMKAFRKRPLPWYKYVIRTREHTVPCPKTDWGWFHCMPGNMWGKYGVESGAAWHRAIENRYWIFDGMIGMCAFSMNLRSTQITHYFTVLNTHPVLDFLYGAYMGTLPYKFLDYRFYNTQWRAPIPRPWSIIKTTYDYGEEFYNDEVPWY